MATGTFMSVQRITGEAPTYDTLTASLDLRARRNLASLARTGIPPLRLLVLAAWQLPFST